MFTGTQSPGKQGKEKIKELWQIRKRKR